ncbi:dihydromonapterin reductase [Vibrio sp. SCSIO 43136]|uniref:dihydromonapterin reductase n=1 Tax=Vibrio sp. SCSIO 43136 TaxID=2819101 RepID=UPI0020759BE9|nr:dihydromonapterin reductase [Vibrio sp. SCSIO 43136]USD66992.1 dihydromonapterin reductase [Vibrio sp. SCSIO 43136]
MSQTVLITGVGKRLGLATTKALLEEGYHVVGTYRTEYPSIAELREQGADLYRVDFYRQSEVDEFIYTLGRRYSSLRAIIHNASDWSPDPSSDTASSSAAETLHKMMTIHAAIPYQLNLALQHQLKENQVADIIHIGDFVAEKGSKKHIAYAASKAAMNNLTLSFASLLAPHVAVNSISPAMIKFNHGDSDEYKKKALAKALLPREAGYTEVTKAIKWLLDSQFMTGRNFQLDGGRHLK